MSSPCDYSDLEIRIQTDLRRLSHPNSSVRDPLYRTTDHLIVSLSLQKTHFWSDYYNGQLSSNGLHTLNSLCDRALDTPKQFIDLRTVKRQMIGKSRWRSLFIRIRRWTHHWQNLFPWDHSDKDHSKREDHANKDRSVWISVHRFFHSFIVSLMVLIVECGILIYQMETNLCRKRSMKENFSLISIHLALESLLILFLGYDLIQWWIWCQCHRQRKAHRWSMLWILVYLLIILCRLTSSTIHLIILIDRSSSLLCRLFWIFKGLCLVECLLLCVYILVPLRFFVDYILNRYISINYEIGLAYISSEEQVLQILHRLTENGI